jgi:hypothetical protein
VVQGVAQCSGEAAAITAHISFGLSGRESRFEPIGEKLFGEEVESPFFLVFRVCIAGEVGDLDLDGSILHHLLESRLKIGFHKVVLAAESNTQPVIDAFEVGGDLHIQRRAQTRELQVVDNADGACALFVSLFQNDGAFLAQRKAEGRFFIALKGRRVGPENFFDRIKFAGLGGGGGGASGALKIERHALYRAGIKLNQAKYRVAGRDSGKLRFDAAFCLGIQLEAGGKHAKAAALGAAFHSRRFVLDKGEDCLAVSPAGQTDRTRQIPELVGISMIRKYSDSIYRDGFGRR